MSEDSTNPPVGNEDKSPRTGRLITWGARIISVPILGLVLSSLVPALLSFSVSARDDQLIAIGLCVTFVGLVVGWRYARTGGAVALAGALLIVSQGDNLLYPDPFAMAFALQAVVFLLAGSIVSAKATDTAGVAWPKKAAIVISVLLALAGVGAILRGPGPVPVSKDQESFVGLWVSPSGLTLEIDSEGFAKLGLPKDAHIQGLHLPIAEGETNTFMAYFQGSERLELKSGYLRPSQAYRIKQRPHKVGKQVCCTLSDEEPQDPGGAVTFVKKTGS